MQSHSHAGGVVAIETEVHFSPMVYHIPHCSTENVLGMATMHGPRFWHLNTQTWEWLPQNPLHGHGMEMLARINSY